MEEKTNQVVLLGIWPSSACASVALALKLKGIPYKYVEEDLTNKSELLLKNNPIHKKVPVLLHNDKAIAESLVILESVQLSTPSSYQEQKKERKKAIENLNEMIKVFYEGVKEDFKEEFPYCKGKCLGLLDIVVGTNAGNYKVINDALGMEVIHPHINSQFLSWMDALREHPLVKDTLPPHDKFVAKFIEKFGPIN
ncbi:hypothetical protein K1719_032592 [Acacia pycnantha]|nr:hypothetical protein K1719_032592 [Acacia pycnantha]